MIRTAVIFSNYGPYHLGRADSLVGIEDIEPRFIELASEIKRYPWQVDKQNLSISLLTLVNGRYEQTPFLKLFKRLSATLESMVPDAVVVPSYSPPIMLAAARWAKRHGAVSIMMNETTGADHPRVWWKERIKRFMVRRYYDAAFVGGTATREYLLKLGMPRERIWEGYDVIDNDYFSREMKRALQHTERHRKRAELPESYLLYVGRFSPEKNLSRLLEAYQSYREREPDGWGLVLVGDGPQREALYEKACVLGLKDIVWPGFKHADELPVYYALASTFVLPSVSEPWGLVVNEAMACGLPVLVSNRCGSAWDLVSEGNNGYTFDPYDTEEIAELMLRLSRSSESERHAMREASREIISGYTPEMWAENLANCIRQTVERGNRKMAPMKWGG